jgi:hypothetical protein
MLSPAQSKLLRKLEAQPYAELSPDNKLLLRRLQEKSRGLPVNKALGEGKSLLDMIQIGREEGTGTGDPLTRRTAHRPPLSQACRRCSTETRAKAAVGKNIYRCPNLECRFTWSGPSRTSIQSAPPKSRILSTSNEE